MAAGNRILRAPGRLVVGPSEAFLTGTFPYGGVQVGRVKDVSLRAVGSPYIVECEGLGGEIQEILERPSRWVLSMFLRGWDGDGIEALLGLGHKVGANTQHATWSAPDVTSGTRASVRSVVLAYVPDDPVGVPGLVAWAAVPHWTDGAEIAYQRGAEFGIPLSCDLMRDSSSRIVTIGKLADIEL